VYECSKSVYKGMDFRKYLNKQSRLPKSQLQMVSELKELLYLGKEHRDPKLEKFVLHSNHSFQVILFYFDITLPKASKMMTGFLETSVYQLDNSNWFD
jgi:hypothetical protein